MLISIIIPTYNRADYIMECLDSVRGQIYQNYEVIIVDDGSTDDTSKILHPLIQEGNRYKYYYQENCGVSRARNLGIDKAQGEYLIFLDSDDKMNKMTLQECVKYIHKNNNLLSVKITAVIRNH